MQGSMGLGGSLSLSILRPQKVENWSDLLRYSLTTSHLPEEVRKWRLLNMPHVARGLRRVWLAKQLNLPVFYGSLHLAVIKRDGRRVDYGLASLRVVTTVGVGFLVDALQGTVEPEIMKYHGIGTGTNAEAVGDTALQTELTTQYSSDNTRATGSLTEGASANIFRTLGTNTVDATVAITEHGILSQAATGGGVLLDRSVFAAVNLTSGDSLASTYDLTLTAGS